jgi:DNA-nicking Smr family endonuclease
LRKLARRLQPVHDDSTVTPPERKSGKRRRDKADEEAVRDAYDGVKPLRGKSPKRTAAVPQTARTATKPARSSGAPTEPLRVERESNGIVLGRRGGAHQSIIDTLEDPKLEVDAEYDLHGLTAREAEREAHLFIRDQQKAGNRWVLLIVGKGLHSPGGKGTLKDHIIGTLSTRAPARFVLAFRTAPRRLGGTGALVVRLVDRL